MSKVKFYVCPICGNIIEKVKDVGVPVMCCGKKMEEIVPNTVDASVEKHTPVVTVEGNVVKVSIGSVEHPMVEEHNIEWVYLCTENGVYRKELKAGNAPEVKFVLDGENPVAVYAYCNLHGLWMTEI